MTDTDERMIREIARLCSLPESRVERTVTLLQGGATIPFITRYRKEATGGLDEVQVGAVRDQLERLNALEARKRTVRSAIEAAGKMTGALSAQLDDCWDGDKLEDLYLPYKPKRRTRAAAAREKGLEPLAALLMRQDGSQPERLADRFVRGEVADREQALAGACDIVAEWVAENARAREAGRAEYARAAVLSSRAVAGREDEGAKYSDYFGRSFPLRRMPSHRLLALFRGEREGFLKLSLSLSDPEAPVARLVRMFVRGDSPARRLVESAVRDSFRRLIVPSIENECLAAAKQRADDEAIRVFADNLRQLLLSAPLGRRRVLAIDPGFRTGCKTVCLDEQGALLHYETIYPHPPRPQADEAVRRLSALVGTYRIEAVAIGDGTAGRETERFVRGIRFGREVPVYMVSEDGASVYSASEVGREEFPDRDATVRGAVSIGRRLIDPLSELVKIDPKSIGVGQYRARRRSGQAAAQPRRNGRKLREPRGRQPEYRFAPFAGLCVGAGARAGPLGGRVSGRERRVPLPARPAESAPARSEGIRAVRGLPAHSGSVRSARRERRAPRVLPGRRANGFRSGGARRRSAVERGASR